MSIYTYNTTTSLNDFFGISGELTEELSDQALQEGNPCGVPPTNPFPKGHSPWHKGKKTECISIRMKKYWEEWRELNPNYKDNWKCNNKKPLSREEYLASRVDNTTALNKKVIECPHCKKSGNVGNMKRWHFDNCKVNDDRYNTHPTQG